MRLFDCFRLFHSSRQILAQADINLTNSIRRAINPTVLPGGLYMPGGASIVLSTINMQRSPTWWGDDADEFKPSRWEGIKSPPQAFKPFNSGPRTVWPVSSIHPLGTGGSADTCSALDRRWRSRLPKHTSSCWSSNSHL
jgi:hypothetical protein